MPTNRIPKGLENRVQVATIKARRVDNKEVILGKRNEEVSGAGELPPCALSEPDLNLSAHPAPIIQPWVLHQTANAEIIRAAFWLFSLTNIPHL